MCAGWHARCSWRRRRVLAPKWIAGQFRNPPPHPLAQARACINADCESWQAVFAIAADTIAAIGRRMNFYQPTGPLSGVTTCAIAVWLMVWAVLGQRWRKRNLALRPILTTALILIGLGILLTFPPLAQSWRGPQCGYPATAVTAPGRYPATAVTAPGRCAAVGDARSRCRSCRNRRPQRHPMRATSHPAGIFLRGADDFA